MSQCPITQSLLVIGGSDCIIWLGREVVGRQQWDPGLGSKKNRPQSCGHTEPFRALTQEKRDLQVHISDHSSGIAAVTRPCLTMLQPQD